jgi:RNA polymerase sigma-70 factor (ECF subfamily)
MEERTCWRPERYRPLLRLQVRQLQLDPRLQARFDPSDLVQDALVKAVQNVGQFRGKTEPEFVAWLLTILRNVVQDRLDEAHALKRHPAREQALRAMDSSSARMERFLIDHQPMPGQQAEHQELLLRLAAAMEQLPEDQRDVLVHYYFLGSTVEQIASRLGRTRKAVAGLLYRGRRQLRQSLGDDV